MHHQAGKWRYDPARADVAPTAEPMGKDIKPAQRKAPTTDQKKVRRLQQRTAYSPQDFADTVISTFDEQRRKYSPAKDWDMGEGQTMTPGADSVSAQSSDSSVSATATVETIPIEQTHTRTIPEDDDFDSYLVTRCNDHGTKITGDRGSQETYLALAQACHDGAQHGSPIQRQEHHRYHVAGGHDCWSCCPEMYVAKPGERESGRTASLHRLATQTETNVASSDGSRILLNPGDSIRLPNGSTTRVRQVRRHETSRDHYYVDTDLGTSTVPWSTKFQIVPQDSRQQSIPSYADPRANSNSIPMNPQNQGAERYHGGSVCPVCGNHTLNMQAGNRYVCSTCGYSATGQGGMSFSDSPQMVNPRRGSAQAPMSAVARRASEVYQSMTGDPL